MWIPGHSDIQGNEQVDAEAKKVAANSTLTQLPRQRPLKSARARHIGAEAKKQWRTNWNENTKTANRLRQITKRKTNCPQTVQWDKNSKHGSNDHPTKDWPLWAKPLSSPIRHQRISVLRVRIRKRDGGTLFTRVQEIQRTKEKANGSCRNRKYESRDSVGRPNEDKGHNDVRQGNGKIKQLEDKTYW